MPSKRKLLVVALILGLGTVAAVRLDLPARLGLVAAPGAALTLYGNVDIRQVQLGFRVAGRIVEMLVDEGDRVTAGAVLARLDAGPQRDAAQAAEAAVAARSATRDKVVAGPRPGEIALAEAQLREQEANLDAANRAFDRAKGLLPSGSGTEAAFDQANAARNAARARVAAMTEQLRLLQEGSRAEDVAAAQADLAAAEATLATARTALGDTELKAPAEGIVLSRVREPGAMAAMGEAVYVLSLERPVWVRAYVSEPDLGQLHPGMAVSLTTDSRPDTPYAGQVGFISPVAEFTPKSVETPDLRSDLVYRLRIVVTNPDAGLRQGMPVTVHLRETRDGG